jgi:hypothetical protein
MPNPTTYPRFKAFDSNGNPASGYLVWSYEAGTLTPRYTYTDRLWLVPNTNPIILDSQGEAVIYLKEAVKLVFTTPTGDPSTPIWVVDYLNSQESTVFYASSLPGTTHNNYVVNVVPALTSLDGVVLFMIPDRDSLATLAATVFAAGSVGINDGIFSGPYVGTVTGAVFRAEIDTVSALRDTYIKLLLHMEDTGAAFTDSSAGAKTVTAHGDVTQSEDWFKFGAKSALFDGAGDYLSLADHADWFLDTGDFTIDFWLNFTTVGNATFFSQYVNANNLIYFDYNAGLLRFYEKSTAVHADYSIAWTPVAGTAYHMELVRSGTDLLLFIDGVLQTWDTITVALAASSLADFAALLTIGYGVTTPGTYLAGYIDEFCWSKGIARNTADFDPPTQAYAVDGVDTFKWTKDGSGGATGVPITTLLQNLMEGVGITFSEFTGHTLGDAWTVTVETPTKVNLCSLGNYIVYKNIAGVLTALGAGDVKAGVPATLVFSHAASCWILNNPSVAEVSSSIPLRVRKKIVAAYTVVPEDQGKEISCAGTFTVTLPACPSVPSHFFYFHRESGTITIDAGSYLIFQPGDEVGSSTLTLDVDGYNTVQLATNGVNWHILTTADKPVARGSLLIEATQDWVCPVRVTQIRVTAIGGGGGGGGGDNIVNGGGAGAVGSVSIRNIAVVPGTTYPCVVGVGGALGAVTVNGGDGVSTTFDTTLVIALRGVGGVAGASPDALGVPAAINPTGAALTDYNAGSGGYGGVAAGPGDVGADGCILLEW